MAEPSPSIRVMALAVLIILVSGGLGGGLLYERNHQTPSPGPRVVALGNNVTVNYVGMFGSGAETHRVFDTSILVDARNNLSYPKSLEYTFRSNLTQYGPLGVHVSPHAPSAGFSGHGTTFGAVVTGFWRGLIGLPGNQSHTITLPPELAYGPQNASCLVSVPLVTHLSVVTTLESAMFSTAYPNVTKAAGTEFSDPTYHWTDLVLSLNATSVSVESLPPIGFVSSGGAWPVTVTNISGGEITLANDIAPSQAGLILGHSPGKVCSTNQFIVSAVDATAGTFTENFNREVAGQTLIFVVTIVDIYP